MFVFLDETEEALAGMLRPGNAGANTAADHVDLLDRAIGQLPELWRLGHRPDEEPSLVVHPILARSDSAGASHGFVDALLPATFSAHEPAALSAHGSAGLADDGGSLVLVGTAVSPAG